MYFNMCWSFAISLLYLGINTIFFQVSKGLACAEKFVGPCPEPLTPWLSSSADFPQSGEAAAELCPSLHPAHYFREKRNQAC